VTTGATNIRALKNSCRGQTIYVVASGASMDFIDRAFFDDKTVVTVNEMFRELPSAASRDCFTLMHHHEHVQEAIDAGCQVVTSEHDCGFSAWSRHAFKGNYFVYRTAENNLSLNPTVNMDALERGADDELIVSPSTVAEAIHFAHHLGASSIVLCGADGAALDGRWCCDGYNGGHQTNPQHVRLTWDIVMTVVQAIRGRDVGVYALHPFIGWENEGHYFEPAPRIEGPALVRALNAPNIQKRRFNQPGGGGQNL